MYNLFLIKVFSFCLIFLPLVSCSYLTPEAPNEYTVSKQSPLIMPPDMNMRPPQEKVKNNITSASTKPSKIEKNIEDILTGQDSNTVNKKEVKNKNNRYKKKMLVRKILLMKEIVVLD